MPKFRKKPVVIEAVTWYGKYTDGTEWPDWFRDAVTTGRLGLLDDGRMLIPTLEGEMTANIGDVVIRGVKGELYPCKPDIFAQTYEPA
jgi:hypothetical protein